MLGLRRSSASKEESIMAHSTKTRAEGGPAPDMDVRVRAVELSLQRCHGQNVPMAQVIEDAKAVESYLNGNDDAPAAKT
jgi:hypothetical protein